MICSQFEANLGPEKRVSKMIMCAAKALCFLWGSFQFPPFLIWLHHVQWLDFSQTLRFSINEGPMLGGTKEAWAAMDSAGDYTSLELAGGVGTHFV